MCTWSGRVCSVTCAHLEARDQLQVSPSTALRFRRQGLPRHLELASLEPGWPASTQNPFLCPPVQPPGLQTHASKALTHNSACAHCWKGNTTLILARVTEHGLPSRERTHRTSEKLGSQQCQLRPHGQGYCLLWEIRVECFCVTEQTHIKNLLFIHALE